MSVDDIDIHQYFDNRSNNMSRASGVTRPQYDYASPQTANTPFTPRVNIYTVDPNDSIFMDGGVSELTLPA